MKKIFASFLVISLLLTMVSTAAYAQTPSAWAQEAVEELKSTGYFDANRFKDYQKPITRLEFIYFAVRLFEVLSGQEVQVDTNVSFNDTSDIWALKGASVGITSGVGNGKFDPNSILNREQLATMLVKTMQLAKLPLKNPGEYRFSDDSEISSWAKEAMYIARENNVLGGVGNNMAAPKQSATVEQCIILINRVLTNYQKNTAKYEFDVIADENGIYAGEITNNIPNGFGAIILSMDGQDAKSIGQWKDGSLNGRGIIYTPDGFRVIGDIKNNVPDGQGILIMPSIGIYKGQFKNGKMHGEGIVVNADGIAAKGQWNNNEILGNPILLPGHVVSLNLESGYFFGEIKDDMADGFGTFITNSGDMYEGEFKNGKMHGLGIITASDGSEYAGEFVDHDLVRGMAYIPGDSLYVGEFKNFKYHGQGILVSLDGKTKYVGEFKDGQFVK